MTPPQKAAPLTDDEIRSLRAVLGQDEFVRRFWASVRAWVLAGALDLRIVADWDTYMALLDGDKVVTVDKYGPAATIRRSFMPVSTRWRRESFQSRNPAKVCT